MANSFQEVLLAAGIYDVAIFCHKNIRSKPLAEIKKSNSGSGICFDGEYHGKILMGNGKGYYDFRKHFVLRIGIGQEEKIGSSAKPSVLKKQPDFIFYDPTFHLCYPSERQIRDRESYADITVIYVTEPDSLEKFPANFIETLQSHPFFNSLREDADWDLVSLRKSSRPPSAPPA